jgi:homoserine kinase type II
MAVYTVVDDGEVRALVARLGLGELTAFEGIRAGIENSNWFVDTTLGRFVLTVFERLTAEQLPYYLWLMKHLAGAGIPVPDPQADAGGELLFSLQGKPAALLTRLQGSHRLAPDEHHCRQVGAMLARMHLAGASFDREQPHLRGLPWWAETVPVVLPFLDAGCAALLREELAFQQTVLGSAAGRALPRGPIHADLFRDNVMFDGLPGHEKLTGFLDFFFAGTDTLAFDIAVCLNDWCTDLDSGRLDEARAAAFVDAYAAVRPLTASEHRLMPSLMRAAALRFWLSRLWDLHLPREAAMLKAHDPTHFERVLREHIATPWHPPAPLS